jgi:hypothetical protein
MLWPVSVQACHTLKASGNAACKLPYRESKQQRQSARADEKARDKNSRLALHRRKTNMHRGFQASMFDTDHQITTFCVLTQHSTVG